jgi:hypothetical protein
MEFWPENGWFIGLRRALFAPHARKRTLAACLIFILLIVAAEVLNQPARDRYKQEQYDVLSSYLFSFPLYARPLPALCAIDPRYQVEGRPLAVIHQYVVSDQTVSAWSQPSLFLHPIDRKIEAPETPVTVINNFFLTNFSVTYLGSGFHGVNSERLRVQHAVPEWSSMPQPSLWAKFSKVGFNRDYTLAMFYAEVRCGDLMGREYVYSAKAFYRGWYWYVYRVDRQQLLSQ